MKTAFDAIKRLVTANAKHIRKDFRLQDVNDEIAMREAKNELAELTDAPDDPSEMADIFIILFHYCLRKHWSLEYVERLMLEKLEVRFDKKRCKTCNGVGLVWRGPKDEHAHSCEHCDGAGVT